MDKRRKFLIFSMLALTSLPNCFPANAEQRVKRTDPNTYYRAPHSLTGKMIVLPIGTTFEGRLSQTLSSAKSHAGESFSIGLSAPVLSNGIDVVIPAGSEVVGEVVEAISSHSQPKQKRMPPPKGKLRVQINLLRTPDGTTYPLVGNLTGEVEGKRGGRSGFQTPLGSSVGFVGTAEAFEAVAPGSNRYGKQITPGRGPEYVKKREFLRDEIYGNGGERQDGIEDRRIRSLVLRKYDLWIDAGSPLTVKLQAPLRLAVTPPNAGMPVGSQEQYTQDEGLPGPSTKGGGGSDIPPITDEGAPPDPSPAPRARRTAPQQSSAPAQSAPPQQQQPAPSTPGASPSSEF